jgi:hypothetical protein
MAELGADLTEYVILRVSEQDRGQNGNRANSLRQIVKHDGYISRAPTPGEAEALRAGLDKMGIARTNY